MLNYTLTENLLFTPFLLNIYIYWKIFFQYTCFFKNFKNNWDSSISIKNYKTTKSPIYLITVAIILNIYHIIYLYTFKGYNNIVIYGHFKVNCYPIYINIILLVFITYFFYLFREHLKSNNYYNIDYVFSLVNAAIISPIMFYTNSLMTFYFVIESVSFCLFFKFILTKLSNNYSLKSKKDFFSPISSGKNYLEILLYQYWASFFSSVMIVVSVLYMFILFGTSEWIIVNNIVLTTKTFSSDYNMFLYIYILLNAIVIKLGIAPYQLYKIEIYKGIPFVTIFFYTTFYFLTFFLYFNNLVNIYLIAFKIYIWVTLVMLISLGIAHTIIKIFNISYYKIFLAYSTILNGIIFILFIIALLL